MNLSDLIERNAAFTPDKPATASSTARRSATRLSRRASQQPARALKSEFGVHRGDRVAILSLNHPDYLVLLYACARLGAMLVPLNWRLAVPEQLFILSDASVKVLVLEQASRRSAPAGRSACRTHASSGWILRPTRGIALDALLAQAQRRRPQSAYRTSPSAADRLHLRHDGTAEGRGAAAGGAAVERRDEPAHARHDLGRSRADRAAVLPCRRAEHPDHAGAAARRHRDDPSALHAGRHARRDRARPADADGAGAGDHPGGDASIPPGPRPTCPR